MPAMRRRLFEIQILCALAEIQLRRGLDAVGAVSEVDLVAIEGEDLFLRVALLDADRDQRFLDLPLPAAIADREADFGGEQVACQLLRDGAAAGRLAARGDVAQQRQHHSRDAEARVLEEPRILRGQDRLAQVLRDVVVVDDDAALDRELANELTILPEHARDGVGRVAVERADFRKVVGIGEQHPAQRAQECSSNEKGRDAGMTSVTNSDLHEMELARRNLLGEGG